MIVIVLVLLILENYKKSKGKQAIYACLKYLKHTYTDIPKHTCICHTYQHRLQCRNSINAWKLIWVYYHEKINHYKTCEPLS